MRVVVASCLFAVCSIACASDWPVTVSGVVVHVDDGDGVVLQIDQARIKVRLSSIDAPEVSHTNQTQGRVAQPYSVQAKEYLTARVSAKAVRAVCFEKDKYARNVCEIFVGQHSVNQEMVAQGWAWANTAAKGRYLRDKSLVALQSQAQALRLGLWASQSPTAPWLWRSLCWGQGLCGD